MYQVCMCVCVEGGKFENKNSMKHCHWENWRRSPSLRAELDKHYQRLWTATAAFHHYSSSSWSRLLEYKMWNNGSQPIHRLPPYPNWQRAPSSNPTLLCLPNHYCLLFLLPGWEKRGGKEEGWRNIEWWTLPSAALPFLLEPHLPFSICGAGEAEAGNDQVRDG